MAFFNNKPATTSFAFGGTSSNLNFGTTPAATATPAFGAPGATPFGGATAPAFGTQPTATQTAAFGGFGTTQPAATQAPGATGFAFGTQPTATQTPAFGFGMQQPGATPGFGTTTTPGFGLPTSTAAPAAASFSGFGAPATTTATTAPNIFGFGQTTTTPAATPAAGFGFPAPAASTPFGATGSFGQTAAFGAQTAGAFGAQVGTKNAQYAQTPDRENSSIKHTAITAMAQFENKSLEELRLEDTGMSSGTAPATTPATASQPFSIGSALGATTTTPATGFGFGSPTATTTPAFGTTPSPAAANPFSFGTNNPATAATTPAFGQSPATTTGLGAATAASSFNFGAPKPATTTGFGFGMPAAGGATTPAFSTPATSSAFSFGGAPAAAAPAASGAPLFGGFGSAAQPAAAAAPAPAGFSFGAPATTPATGFNFGTAPQQPTAGLFGAKPAATTTSFSTAPATAQPAFNFAQPAASTFPNLGAATQPAAATQAPFSLFGSGPTNPAPAATSTFNMGSGSGFPAFGSATPQATPGPAMTLKSMAPESIINSIVPPGPAVPGAGAVPVAASSMPFSQTSLTAPPRVKPVLFTPKSHTNVKPRPILSPYAASTPTSSNSAAATPTGFSSSSMSPASPAPSSSSFMGDSRRPSSSTLFGGSISSVSTATQSATDPLVPPSLNSWALRSGLEMAQPSTAIKKLVIAKPVSAGMSTPTRVPASSLQTAAPRTGETLGARSVVDPSASSSAPIDLVDSRLEGASWNASPTPVTPTATKQGDAMGLSKFATPFSPGTPEGNKGLSMSFLATPTPVRPRMSAAPSTTSPPAQESISKLSGSMAQPSDADLQAIRFACPVQLTKPGYWCRPSLQQLGELAIEADKASPGQPILVDDFTIGRHGYAEVVFLGKTDVRSELVRDLDNIVDIAHLSVEVYPVGWNRDFPGAPAPSVGSGLNKKSRLTFERCWPREKGTNARSRNPERIEKYVEKLVRTATEEWKAKHISYDAETGKWVVEVEHFSKYKLDEDDSDDEDDGQPLQQPVQQQGFVGMDAEGSAMVPPRRLFLDDLNDDMDSNMDGMDNDNFDIDYDDDDDNGGVSGAIPRLGGWGRATNSTAQLADALNLDRGRVLASQSSFFRSKPVVSGNAPPTTPSEPQTPSGRWGGHPPTPFPLRSGFQRSQFSEASSFASLDNARLQPTPISGASTRSRVVANTAPPPPVIAPFLHRFHVFGGVPLATTKMALAYNDQDATGSLRADPAHEVDPMLLHCRSFRVGWLPGGVFVHCGVQVRPAVDGCVDSVTEEMHKEAVAIQLNDVTGGFVGKDGGAPPNVGIAALREGVRVATRTPSRLVLQSVCIWHDSPTSNSNEDGDSTAAIQSASRIKAWVTEAIAGGGVVSGGVGSGGVKVVDKQLVRKRAGECGGARSAYGGLWNLVASLWSTPYKTHSDEIFVRLQLEDWLHQSLNTTPQPSNLPASEMNEHQAARSVLRYLARGDLNSAIDVCVHHFPRLGCALSMSEACMLENAIVCGEEEIRRLWCLAQGKVVDAVVPADGIDDWREWLSLLLRYSISANEPLTFAFDKFLELGQITRGMATTLPLHTSNSTITTTAHPHPHTTHSDTLDTIAWNRLLTLSSHPQHQHQRNTHTGLTILRGCCGGTNDDHRTISSGSGDNSSTSRRGVVRCLVVCVSRGLMGKALGGAVVPNEGTVVEAVVWALQSHCGVDFDTSCIHVRWIDDEHTGFWTADGKVRRHAILSHLAKTETATIDTPDDAMFSLLWLFRDFLTDKTLRPSSLIPADRTKFPREHTHMIWHILWAIGAFDSGSQLVDRAQITSLTRFHLDYAFELECMGLWDVGVCVLWYLHTLSRNQTSPFLPLARTLILRHCAAVVEGMELEDTEACLQVVQQETALGRFLSMSAPLVAFVHEAIALRCRVTNDVLACVHHALKSNNPGLVLECTEWICLWPCVQHFLQFELNKNQQDDASATEAPAVMQGLLQEYIQPFEQCVGEACSPKAVNMWLVGLWVFKSFAKAVLQRREAPRAPRTQEQQNSYKLLRQVINSFAADVLKANSLHSHTCGAHLTVPVQVDIGNALNQNTWAGLWQAAQHTKCRDVGGHTWLMLVCTNMLKEIGQWELEPGMDTPTTKGWLQEHALHVLRARMDVFAAGL